MKKFIDQAWLEEPWFEALKPQNKLAFFFVWTKCDLVGVWSGNKKIANMLIGYDIKWDEFEKVLGDKVKVLSDGKWWLTQYCPLQFGVFSPESRVHQAAKRALNGYGIKDEDSQWIAYPIGYQEATDSLKRKDKDKDKEKNGMESPERKGWKPDEIALRLAAIYGRRESTQWTKKEIDAYKSLGSIDLDDLRLVERYTAAQIAKGSDGIHRRDLQTLLNNFAGEIDRAKVAASKPKNGRVLEWADSRPAAKPIDPAEDERIRQAALEQARTFREGRTA